MSIRYPVKALNAFVYLFRRYNDIDIFVEDTTNRKMYEVLLQRMLGSRAKLRRIFQLPGCDSVVEKCREKQTDSDRHFLCIIDGDFNSFLGNECYPELNNFYQLKVYCVENLLFSEKSLLEIASECLTNCSHSEVKTKLGFDAFLKDITEKLTPLIIIYYTTHILDNTITTTGLHVDYFYKEIQTGRKKEIQLDTDKITRKIQEIKESLRRNFTQDKIEEQIHEIQSVFPTDGKDVVKFICGRKYIIPLAYHHLHRKVRYKGDEDQLKVRMARHCELNIDPDLERALIKAAKGY